MFKNQAAKDLFEKLQKKYNLGSSTAIVIVLDNFPEELREITPHEHYMSYKGLPEQQKEHLFQKMVILHKDFQFWKDCSGHAGGIGDDEFREKCQEQMAEFADNFDQLSNTNNSSCNYRIRGLVIEKMKKFVKEQPDKV